MTIPNNVTSIGNGAFEGCSGLTSINIPNSVTSIGNGAFRDCSGLTSFVVESGNTKYNSRNNCNAIIETATNTLIAGCKNTVIPNSVTSIDYSAFEGCSSLISIEIPNSITSIRGSAFYGCSGLTSVTIPNSVTSIGRMAFYNCSGLTSVTIGNSVTSIEEYAFSHCSGLISITIPNSVTSIGDYAFSACYVEEGQFINNSRLNAKAKNYWGLSFVDSREDGFIIDNGVLIKYTGSESSVTIPNIVASIREYAFEGCSGLTSVTIPNNVTSIGNVAFYGCSGLTSVTIPNSVTSVGNAVFKNCSGLTSVTIPSGVTSIGDGFFENCSSLTSVTCEATSVPSTGWDVFSNVPRSNATLYVPASALDSYKATAPWNAFGTIVAIPDGALRGDVNDDGIVNGTDIQAIINAIVEGEYDEKADVNEDEQVNGTDIQEVINIIVNAE